MLKIQSDYSLTRLNTFGVKASARHYVRVTNQEDLLMLNELPHLSTEQRLILGGGSNLLFTEDFPGLVIHPVIQGVEVIKTRGDHIWVRAGCGMEWDDFVAHAVANNWGGIENLSLIPGNVGAAPVQNIGAYGVEVKDVIDRVEGIDLDTGQTQSLDAESCRFEYRNSVFKHTLKNRFLVSSVVFRLTQQNHTLVTHYGSIENELRKLGERSIATVREVVIGIREAKLPDHRKTGNAGSFFKNPVVSEDIAGKLLKVHENMPAFPDGAGRVKLSAAWLIDKAGLKGVTHGNVGTYPLQPLVVINKGNAGGAEIHDFSIFIQQQVEARFGITLEPEVNIL